jgi:hypothetical protein
MYGTDTRRLSIFLETKPPGFEDFISTGDKIPYTFMIKNHSTKAALNESPLSSRWTDPPPVSELPFVIDSRPNTLPRSIFPTMP